jgi:hypothetical protein
VSAEPEEPDVPLGQHNVYERRFGERINALGRGTGSRPPNTDGGGGGRGGGWAIGVAVIVALNLLRSCNSSSSRNYRSDYEDFRPKHELPLQEPPVRQMAPEEREQQRRKLEEMLEKAKKVTRSERVRVRQAEPAKPADEPPP